ncbi:MAG: sigma-70 family RNA polymerase sigma factor [Chloroflexi bacterium]|nr:sigma-70 family RNA polymerase sigma factor [Chloroflexota bacterium]
MIRSAQEGNAAAFGALYQRHVSAIYSYCYQRTGSRPDAEDLASRTFHQALKSLDRYVITDAPVTAWLYRIAHNLVANWHRDRQRRPTIRLTDDLGLMARGQSPQVQAERGEENQALRAAIRRLPPIRQQVLILRFGQDLSNRQIGEIIGRSEGAVKVLVHRSLKELRQELTRTTDLLDRG